VAGLLTVEDPNRSAAERHFALPPGSEAVLLDQQSPSYLVPFADFLEAVCRVLPDLQSAFRSGNGVPYADYAVQHAQGALNRPGFTGRLVQNWLPQIPDLHARLRAGGTVAELGCGEGWASIALAFEVIHDLADPVSALRTARRLTDGGRTSTIVMDERAAEEFRAPADSIERFLYAVSVLHCLPVGRSAPGSVATGTVLRPEVLRRYADAAGFATVATLPIDDDVFRFYRLGG
jgi:hypothetical protein